MSDPRITTMDIYYKLVEITPNSVNFKPDSFIWSIISDNTNIEDDYLYLYLNMEIPGIINEDINEY